MKYEVNESGEIIKPNKQNFTFVWVIAVLVLISLVLYNLSSANNDSNINKNNEKITISKDGTPTKNITNYSYKIRSFLKAEDSRNFNEVYKHLSKNMKKYWMYDYPTYSELKKHYKINWSKSHTSKNYILSIDRINQYTYDYTVQFDYHHKKSDEKISIESEIRIVFDEEGKIVEIYGL